MAIGRHLIADFYLCEAAFLDDAAALEKEMIRAAITAGAQVKISSFCRFTPQGVSGVVIIAESHLAIHTYPEMDYAALDFFTCGHQVDPRIICELLVGSLQPKVVATQSLSRGQHLAGIGKSGI